MTKTLDDLAPVGVARVIDLLRKKQARAAHYDDVCGVAADAIEALTADLDRLRYVLEGVRSAIDTGRNEPLMVWRDQINIALDAK